MASILRTKQSIIRLFTTTALRSKNCENPHTKFNKVHIDESRKFRAAFFFVAGPLIVLLTIKNYFSNLHHLKRERMPFVKYSYLRRRTKRFPWGDGTKSLFHNPHFNALPDGYEDELEE